MKKINALLIVAVLGAASAARAEDAPEERLWTALQPAKVGYTGRMSITRWHGPKALAEELQVSFRPPNLYRWEFFKPDGSRGRVVVSDGEHECVRLA
ncbi:MAG: hypothetical protein JO102_02750, partial [Elusimicrobia bacterium]|nr:hypothetical protein [Elusimicrobiota bacterium]